MKTWTLIIPMRELKPRLEFNQFLTAVGVDLSQIQVLAIVGDNPSEQRNAGIRLAEGTGIILWDDDSAPVNYYWGLANQWLTEGESAVLGGPALLCPDTSELEKLFQRIFGDPRTTGPSASRYTPVGVRRMTTERELIGCNLLVRKEVFDRVGFFDPGIYPNEENEWMERVRHAGLSLEYDPEFQICRRQRETWKSFFAAWIRYGRGRTNQSIHTMKWDWPRFAPALAWVGLLASVILLGWIALVMFFVGWVGHACFSMIGHRERGASWKESIVAGSLGVPCVMSYGIGQWLELWRPEVHDGSMAKVFQWSENDWVSVKGVK